MLYTGGKDSTLALMKAMMAGAKIVALVSVIPMYDYSMLYHRPYFRVLVLQAQSMGIPLETADVYSPQSEEAALENLLSRAKAKYGADCAVSGAIASNYQRRVFERISRSLGMEPYNPNWGENQEAYLASVLSHGIKFMLVSIAAMGIPHRLLGRVFEHKDVEEIVKLSRKYGFNPSFEGGEGETLVVDAPVFRYRIEVEGYAKSISEYEGVFVITNAWLKPKRLGGEGSLAR